MYMSGHPLESRADELRAIQAAPLASLSAGDASSLDGQWVTVAGILNSVRLKTTKAGAMIAYVVLEDMSGTVEMMVFSRLLQQAASLIREGEVVMVRAQVSVREDEAPKLKVDQIAPLSASGFPARTGRPVPAAPVRDMQSAAGRLYVKICAENAGKLTRMEALMRIFMGLTPVVLYDVRSGEKRRAPAGVDAQPLFLSELFRLMGGDAVVLK